MPKSSYSVANGPIIEALRKKTWTLGAGRGQKQNNMMQSMLSLLFTSEAFICKRSRHIDGNFVSLCLSGR